MSRTQLHSSTELVGQGALYHGAKRSRLTPAIRPTTPQPAMMVVMGSGKTAQMLKMREAVPPTVQQRKFNRWSLQSAKRTFNIKAIAGRLPGDRGFGSTCPLRVIRKTIAIGRPEYQGAGVWA
jgi:hypothetical protein